MSLDRKAPKLEPYTESLMNYPYDLSPSYEQIRTSPPTFPDQNLNSEYQDSQLKVFSPDQMVEEAAKKRENRLSRVRKLIIHRLYFVQIQNYANHTYKNFTITQNEDEKQGSCSGMS